MDPYSAAFSAIGGAVAGGPSSADSGFGTIGNQFDGSGWTVSTGRGQSTGATIARADGANVPSLGGFDINTIAILALVGVVAWKALQR